MREYKIYKTDLGYGIYKKREVEGRISLWFLGWDNKRILNKDHARTFYHREDAVGALVVMRRQWRTEETSEDQDEQKEKSEKQSWSEL